MNSPAEAIRAITANKPEFTSYLLESQDKGLAFRIFAGKETLPAEALRHPVSNKEVIRIVPVLLGTSGAISAVAGAVLVAAGIYFEMPWLVNIGVGMIVGGVAGMLAGRPPTATTEDKEENKPSFSFNGGVNSIVQGGCVPVCYGGPIEVGSYVVSGSVDSRDIPI